MEEFLRTTDLAIFEPPFENAIVSVPPGVLDGSANTVSVLGVVVAVQGDEVKITSTGSYIAPPYTISGTGMARIKKLNADQISTQTTAMGRAVLLKGTKFEAIFTVQVPAQQPVGLGTIPDSKRIYTGYGHFETTNYLVDDYT